MCMSVFVCHVRLLRAVSLFVVSLIYIYIYLYCFHFFRFRFVVLKPLELPFLPVCPLGKHAAVENSGFERQPVPKNMHVERFAYPPVLEPNALPPLMASKAIQLLRQLSRPTALQTPLSVCLRLELRKGPREQKCPNVVVEGKQTKNRYSPSPVPHCRVI